MDISDPREALPLAGATAAATDDDQIMGAAVDETATDDSSDGGGAAEERSVNPESSRRFCGLLFQWVCQNCTQPNPVAQPTPPMLAYAAAVEARMLAVRELAMARASFARRTQAYAEAVAQLRAASTASSSAGPPSILGSTASATAAAASSTPAGVGEESAPSSAPRVDRFAAVAQFVDRASVLSRLTASGPTAAPAPAPQLPPARPDFDAMEAALPTVPDAHPEVPLALLEAQSCAGCRAAYTRPSAPISLPRASLSASGHHHGHHHHTTNHSHPHGVAGAVGGPIPSAAHTGASAVPDAAAAAATTTCPNLSILRVTLSDEDADEYLSSRYGPHSAAAIEAILASPPPSAASSAPTASLPSPPSASSSSSAHSPVAHSSASPAAAAASQQQRPLACIAYDEAMLLHEEEEAPAESDRASSSSLRLYVPGVRLPPAPKAPHPERPDRLRAIAQHLAATGLFSRCARVGAREVTRGELATVHDEAHISAIEALPALLAASGGRGVHFGSDTFANAHSLPAAKLSCGAVVAVTEAVMRGDAERGIALVRPPGHHAEEGEAMGFCLYNNVGVAAAVARQRLGAQRVLIVDWDVHHGNGTQHMFEFDPTVLYVSLHRHDDGTFYPGTGAASEMGKGPGLGYTLNVPWPHGGMGDAEYLAAFDELIMPVAQSFAPDLVLISAGFDAARDDPLGGCDLTPVGYAHMTHRLLSLARGRVVVALEGGYNLTSISRGMEAVVRVLLGEAPPPHPRFTPPWLHSIPSNVESGHVGSDDEGEGAGGAAGRAHPAHASSSSSSPSFSAADASGEAAAEGDGDTSRGGAPPSPSSSSSSSSGGGKPGGGRHALAVRRGVPSSAACPPATGPLGADTPSPDGLPSTRPRANTFYLPTREEFTLGSLAEGMRRDDVLVEQGAHPSALRTIVHVLALHALHWPVLRAKYRAFAKHAAAAMKEQVAAAAAAAAAGGAPGDPSGGAGGAGAAAARHRGDALGLLSDSEGEDDEGEGGEEGSEIDGSGGEEGTHADGEEGEGDHAHAAGDDELEEEGNGARGGTQDGVAVRVGAPSTAEDGVGVDGPGPAKRLRVD